MIGEWPLQTSSLTILLVAQLEHQLVACFGVLSQTKPAAGYTGRESKIWK